jgi:hypothetical protein
MITHEQF